MGSFSKLWKETDLGLARSVRRKNFENVDHQKWTSKVPACVLTPESPGSSAVDDFAYQGKALGKELAFCSRIPCLGVTCLC